MMPRVSDCGVRSCQETSIGSLHITTHHNSVGKQSGGRKLCFACCCSDKFSGTSLLKRNTRERESIIDQGCSFLCLCQKLYRINREFGGWRRFGSTIEENMAGLQQEIASSMQAVGLSDDDAGVQRLKLINQATFFHCVEEGNANTLQVILKNRKIDVNAYNDEVREKSS